MTTLDLDALEAGLEGVTKGPWQVAEGKLSYRIETISGQMLEGEHTERRIFTAWDHPQMKAPQGVVNSCVAVSKPGQPHYQLVAISDEDADHIARCDPDTIRELIRLARLGLEAERGWQPIETAPALDRVLVAGWQPEHGNVRGYWYYGEDTTDEAGKPMEHMNALLWRPWPAVPTTPPTGGEND